METETWNGCFRGLKVKKRIIYKPMLVHQCHRNVALLYARNEIDSVVTGKAFNGVKWVEHSWGIKDGNIIETTGLFFEDYRGKALNERQARRFIFNELAFSDFPEDRRIYEAQLFENLDAMKGGE